MPKRGRSRKKARTQNTEATDSAVSALGSTTVPKSLVVRRDSTGPEVAELVHDMRLMLQPYTALKFQESPSTTLSQYHKHLCAPMGISHIFLLKQNDPHLHLRLARIPAGPTLHFRVHQFSLAKHIVGNQRRPVAWSPALSGHPPLVVTQQFGGDKPHVKLMRITFQNLFPALNVATVSLKECRRVVLFQHMPQDDGPDFVELRHYAITTRPKGANKRIQKLLQKRHVPNLGKLRDVADYIEGNGYASASDASDSEEVISLPDSTSSTVRHQALKLVELGPRLKLELIKVEQGLGEGAVLYHAHLTKTPEEAQELEKRKRDAAALRQQRKVMQERNVARKLQEKEEKKKRKLERKQGQAEDADVESDDEE